jgi:hypothetical protein
MISPTTAAMAGLGASAAPVSLIRPRSAKAKMLRLTARLA